jgi:DDE superfamily endonuclease
MHPNKCTPAAQMVAVIDPRVNQAARMPFSMTASSSASQKRVLPSGRRADSGVGPAPLGSGRVPPAVVKSSGSRFSLNMVSAISAKGSMRFMVVEGRMNGERFMAFLKRRIHNAGRPIFLVVDGHPSH